MPSNPFEALVPGGSSASGNPFDSLVPPPDTTGDTMRGIKVSLGQTGPILKGLVGLAGATAENTFGKGGVSTAVKNWGLDGYNEGMQKLQPMQRDTDELTTAWARAKQGDIGALVDWAQYGLGYAIGQGGEALATSLIGGAIGAAAGGGALSPVIGAGGAITGLVAKGAVKEAAQSMIEKAVVREANALMTASAGKAAGKLTAEQAVKQATKNVASNIGSTSALLAYGGAQELGSIYPEAEAEARKNGRELDGYDLARVWGAGLAAGGIEGLTDKLGVNLALGKLKFPGSASRLGNAAKIGAGGVVVEGATEAAQTAIERVGAQQEVFSDEGIKDIINSAGLGAIGGGAIGGAAGLLHGPQPATAGTPTAEPPPVEPPAAVAKADAAMGRLAGAATIDDAISAFSDAHVPVGETIEGRVQAVRDELSNRAVMDALRAKYGDDSASQFLNSLNQAGNPNVPEAVRDKHLTAIETMLFELNARREPDAALALEGLPDTAALGYDGAPPQIGMGSTPTGAYRVGPDGVAVPETAADVTAGRQWQFEDEPQAPQGGEPGSGVMVGEGTLTPGVSRREAAPQTAMQIAMQAARAKLDAKNASPVDQAAHEAATSPTNDRPEPTQAQKEAGNYAKGHVTISGLDISVENPQGSERSGVDRDGKAWTNTLNHHYGYFKGSVGMDGDHIDTFIKPGTPLDYDGPVFVVDQIHPDTGKPDEHKVMIGFATVNDARAAYESNYAPGWKGLKDISATSMTGFKQWLAEGDTAKPFRRSLAERAASLRNQRGPRGAQPDVAVLAALSQGGVAGAGDQPRGSGGVVGRDPAVARRVGDGAAAPALGSGANAVAGGADQPDAALSQRADAMRAKNAPAAASAEQPAVAPEKPRVFKTRKNAIAERDRLGNEHKLQKIKGGYILRRKTDKEMAAEAKAGQRLRSGAASGRRRSLLATIAAGGGINIDERPDTIGEGNRNVGGRMVFTRAGKTINQWAETLAESGFIPPSEAESDDGVRWLQEAIGEEFAGRREHFAMDDEARMEEAARASQGEEPAPDDDPFGPLSDFDLEELSADGYAAASPEVQAAAEQLLAEAESHGIDTEAIREDAAIQTEGLTDDEYHAEVQRLAREALAAARGNAGRSDASAARGSDQDRSEVAGEEGSAREGLTLETQDAKSLREKTEREAAAKAADAKQKADEQRRLEREAIERETRDRARQDASAENFQLGQDANDALAGQGSIFDVPAEAVASLSKNDREVEAGDDEVSESSLLDADASRVLVKETVRERPTKRQNASPYARFAAGEYVISVQQFPHGPGAVLHVVRHVGDIRSVERAPNEMLEDPAFSSLNDKARDLFARERAGQSSIFDLPQPDAAARTDSQPAPDGETAARKSEAAAPARQVERDERDRSGLDAADRRRRDLDAAAGELAGQIANDMLDGQYATPADRSEIAPGLRHFAELGSVPADDLRQEVLKRILADERLTKRQTKQIVDALDPTRKSKQVTAAPAKLEDAGQKIGGSRKDKWAQRGLIAADLDEMSESEGAQLVTKANVWKPDYAGMVADGATPQAAALVKVIFDSLAAKPRANTPQGRRDYVTAMQAVRSVYGAVKTEADATNAVHKLRDALGLNARLDGSPAAQQDARRVLFSVYKGRSDPFVIFYNEKRRASKLVEAGFPGVIEPWTRQFTVRGVGGDGITDAGLERYLRDAEQLGTPLTEEQLRAGAWWVGGKGGNTVAYAATKADAEAAAKTIYDASKSGGEKAKEPQRPHLDEIERDGLERAIDRDVTAGDFINDFGFRGVEWGNWAAQDERQRIANFAYDALADLARILNLPRRALSLNGTMGMAFGARGGGRFAAHYEPGKLVINMTKLNGAGSLAHEWAHAFDHYIGELDQANAYQGLPRGASGWHHEAQYNGVPIKSHVKDANGKWVPTKQLRLANLRPELAERIDAVMRALFTGQQSKTDMLAEMDMQIERTERYAATETESADLRKMYESEVEKLRAARAKVASDPDDKTYPKGRSQFAAEAQRLSGKSSSGYWLRPTEMFARAFEAYVFDRLVAMGAKSQYLVHGVEADRYASGYKGNPYPTGEERATINRAFDALVAELKTRETDQGVAVYEPQATYGVANEGAQADNAPYETDLFGQPLPAASRANRRAAADRSGLRGNVQPEPGVPADTQAPPGDYYAPTVVGVVTQRKLGAARINSPQEAAQATQYLYESAVERFDGIVTDKNGKPLAVVGGFKGALSQTSVYPATLMGEAVRVPGAARIWFSHNHPSGSAALSRADEFLNSTLMDVFGGSGIEPMGLLAVSGDEYGFVHSYAISQWPEPIPPSTTSATVPVIERRATKPGQKRPGLTSPAAAKAAASAYYAASNGPGLMLLDAQHGITAWVPIQPQMTGRLRATGGLNAIYRAVSESNAGAAVIVHGGELDGMVAGAVTAAQNIAAALQKLEVRALDIIDAKTGESAAERNRTIAAGPVYSVAGAPGQTTRAALRAALKAEFGADVIDALEKAGLLSVANVPPASMPSDVAGATEGERIRLFAANTPADSTAVAYHEALHATLRRMIGDAAFDALMARMPLLAAGNRKWFAEAADRIPADTAKAARNSELASYAVEQYQRAREAMPAGVRKWVQDLIAAIKVGLGKALQAAGVGLKLRVRLLSDAAVLHKLARDGLRTMAREAGQGAMNEAPAFSAKAPPFYSALLRSVRGLGMNAAPAKGWADAIKGLVAKGSVKADEVEWSGVNEWLALQEGKVSRAAMVEFIENNGVRVTETVLGGTRPAFRVYTRAGQFEEAFESREEAEEVAARIGGDIRDGEIARAMTGGDTKYAQYTLPGGANYREVLLTLPLRKSAPVTWGEPQSVERNFWAHGGGLETTQEWIASDGARIERQSKRGYVINSPDVQNSAHPTLDAAKAYYQRAKYETESRYANRRSALGNYQSAHWGQPNILAHIRVNDRTDADGKRVLFVEELQSDWGQDGKKKGFADPAKKRVVVKRSTGDQETVARFATGDEAQEYIDAHPGERLVSWVLPADDGPPAAPFVTKTDAWLALALKRIIKMAVDEGYDKVAFITGEQSAERYDLSKQVRRISWTGDDVADRIVTIAPNAGNDIEFRVLQDGTVVGISRLGRGAGEFQGKHLSDVVGKDAADKIMAERSGGLSGSGLRVGGEGMRAFYDKIVPSVLKDVLRKVGGGQLGAVGIEAREQPGFDITPAMREKAAGGLPLFSVAPQTDSAAFRKWFGDSKVVDAQGRPLVVYHGTRGDFDTFDAGRQGQSDFGASGRGFYFSQDPGTANVYATLSPADGAPNIVPVYLKLENPLELGAMLPQNEEQSRALTEAAKEAGHDGIVVRGADGVLDEVVVFRPEQIKSAIGNSGAFDPANPDIRYSRATATDTAAFKKWFGASVVTENGRAGGVPLVVYHGTPKVGFTTFDTSNVGAFFSDRFDIAASYAGRYNDVEFDEHGAYADDMQGVYASYLSLENPMVVDWAGKDWGDGPEGLKLDEWASRAKRAGRDGLIVENVVDSGWLAPGIVEGKADGRVFVAFRPEQIKSAIGNNGDFDGANPDIRYSRAAPQSPAGPAPTGLAAAAQRLRNAGGGSRIIGQTARQYTPEQIEAMRNVGFQVEAPTLEERIKSLWKDAGKKLAQGLVDQFAPVRAISEEAYGLLRLAKGASGAFETLLKGGKLKLTEGVYDFDDTDKGGVIESLLMPLQGEHHDFLRWVAANRAERLASEGKENLFSDDDIDNLKSLSDGTTDFDYTIQHGARAGQVTRDRTLIYEDSLKTFNAFNKNVLDMAEQSGLIDGESRAVWEHEFYVPFYRVADEDDGGVKGMNVRSGAVRQEAFKRLKGGRNELNADLLDNTLLNWAHLLDASAKNRAAKATLEAAEQMGAAISSTESAVRDMGAATQKKNGVVWVMDEGVKRFYLVDDPHLLQALVGLEYAGMRGPMMKAMGAFKHALTVGVTASPFFKIRNLIRDSVQAIGTGPISYNPAGNVAQGWALTDPKSDAYFRLLAGGGTIHFGTMMEGNEAKRVQALVESGVDSATILDGEHKIKAFYRKFIEPGITAYNELGNRGEAINRASLYAQLRAQGVGHAQASLQARDLMDFSMQGTFASVRFLTQVVPFLNARIQGLYKLGRAAKEDPARIGVVLGATTLASLSLLLAFGDDDDWKKREDWDRNNFWWFKFGGTAFRIPKPFEIGAIATLAERGFELAFDKEMTGTRFRGQVLKLLGDNLAMNPVPQLVKPMLDVYANVNSFTGRPIETMSMERLRPQYRFTDRTSMTARAASTAANAVTGLVGVDGPSPVQIDHMLRGYFGWLGTFIVGTADVIARPATGQPSRPASDVWRTATGNMASDLRDAPSRYVSQMYEQARVIEEAYGTWRALLKSGESEEAAEFFDENRDTILKRRLVERQKSSLTEMNQRIRAIERGNMTADEKRAAIRELQARKDMAARVTAMAR